MTIGLSIVKAPQTVWVALWRSNDEFEVLGVFTTEGDALARGDTYWEGMPHQWGMVYAEEFLLDDGCQ